MWHVDHLQRPWVASKHSNFVSAIAKFLTNFLPIRRFNRSTVSHLFFLLKLSMQDRRGLKGDGQEHVVRLQWPRAALEISDYGLPPHTG